MAQQTVTTTNNTSLLNCVYRVSQAKAVQITKILYVHISRQSQIKVTSLQNSLIIYQKKRDKNTSIAAPCSVPQQKAEGVEPALKTDIPSTGQNFYLNIWLLTRCNREIDKTPRCQDTLETLLTPSDTFMNDIMGHNTGAHFSRHNSRKDEQPE